MKTVDFDLIVIGSGPGGQRAALQSAKAGKKVAIVDDVREIGGGCVHYGTLPSKSFRESVYRFSLSSQGALNQHRKKGKSEVVASRPEMKRLLERRDQVVREEVHVIADQLKRNNVTVLSGRARFVNSHEIDVDDGTNDLRRYSATYFVIAVGATPVTSEKLGLDGKTVYDSNTILGLECVPERMIVLGAGIIGCEYASMFSMAGTKVILVDKRKEILASVDREIVAHLVQRFEHQGVEIRLSVEATALEKGARGENQRPWVSVTLSDGSIVDADCVLVAQGRFGNTNGLGLENTKIQPDDRGLLKVDANFRTSEPHIYAVGDVIGPPALASTSMEQGRIAACHAFDIEVLSPKGERIDPEMPLLYPYGIYTIPEISMIGRTEEELKADGIQFVAGKARYKELARGQIVGDQWGLLKILVDKTSLKILGVHIVGDNAADLIHIGQAVMLLEGDVTYFIHSVFNYPTLAEAYKTASFHAVNLIRGTTQTR